MAATPSSSPHPTLDLPVPAASKLGPCGVLDWPPFFFKLAFQPIVNPAKRRIEGHEALARGRNGEGAVRLLKELSANQRIHFDQIAWSVAMRTAAEAGIATRLHLNMLPTALAQPRCRVLPAMETVGEAGWAPDLITLEILECERITKVSELARVLRRYRDLGTRIALDDFGAGYSGLRLLADLGPDSVKLDKSLVRGCDRVPARRAIVESVASLCRELRVKLIAEGVETAGEVRALQAAGVECFQGFLFARPRLDGFVSESEVAWDWWDSGGDLPACAAGG